MNVLGCYVPSHMLAVVGLLIVLVVAATWNEMKKW